MPHPDAYEIVVASPIESSETSGSDPEPEAATAREAANDQ
jgi:hypothetical protein